MVKANCTKTLVCHIKMENLGCVTEVGTQLDQDFFTYLDIWWLFIGICNIYV